jgi:hypothetical protein
MQLDVRQPVLLGPGEGETITDRAERWIAIKLEHQLNLMAPGEFAQYLKEVAAATAPGEPPDPAVMAEITSRYDFVPQ